MNQQQDPSKTMVFVNSRAQRPNIKTVLEKGPRNEKGDPQFSSLKEMTPFLNEGDVVYLVNKALYQLDYQSAFHRRRNEEMKLLRQQAAERKAKEPSQEIVQTTVFDPKMVKAAATAKTKSLNEALAALRKETDADLGPSGEFSYTEELIPPSGTELSEEDSARLDAAFAKPPEVAE